TRKARRANRKVVRWAVRHRNKPVFLFALLWLPSLSVVGLVLAIMSIRADPNAIGGPLVGVILLTLNKVGALLVYLLEEWMRLKKALRMYNRLTVFAS